MASSFAEQIPIILHVVRQLRPTTVLDIGKGFGKYGLLLHEYCGVDYSRKPEPGVALKEQSSIAIDAVEVNRDYDFPHNNSLYREIFWQEVMAAYEALPQYDVVLMVDVIEHLSKENGVKLVEHFVNRGSVCVIASPREYFQQDLFDSHWEHHQSFWTAADLRRIANVEYQSTRTGRVYVVSRRPTPIVGFGNNLLQKLKRIVWAILNER